jgi:nucleoside-diphosphate kinase
MIERTFVAIKPDGVMRGLVGEVLKRFENAGLKMVGMKMFWVDRDFSKKHYSAHVSKPFYKGLEEYIVSGPVVAIVLEGVHAVEVVRKIVGGTEPTKAVPGTIRGDFSHHSMEYTDKAGKSVMNLIHASGNKKEADSEIELWFTKKELYSYKMNHEHHVF